MKIYKRYIALILVAGMMLASSCGKTAEESDLEETSEAETTTVETTVEETTAETSEETTEQTEETSEAEESEAVERPDAIEFDISEFPFEINESTFVDASENAGGMVMYGTDAFMSFVARLQNGEDSAMEQYTSGISVVVNGDEVDSLIEQFGDPSASMDSGFDQHLTDMGIFTAADPYTQNYQIVVMYYQVDDSEYLAEWFDSASDNYITRMPAQFTENEDYQMDMNWYTDEDGDAYALLNSYVLTDDAVEETGYPDHSGAFIGIYVSGNTGMYISLIDFSDDATGIDMLDEFCDTMGIISPVEEFG